METLRAAATIATLIEIPVVILHPKWFELPAKWAQYESTIDEAEQILLMQYIEVFCTKHGIAPMADSMVGPQYSGEAIRHVHDILFGRHRRPERHKQEKRIQVQTGGRFSYPPFCTSPPPPAPQKPSEYPEANKEVVLPKRTKYMHIDMWMRIYSRIPADKSDAVRTEAEAYCFRFNVSFRGKYFIPTVLQHVHDSMYPPFWRAGRKKKARKLQYTYPGYGYTSHE